MEGGYNKNNPAVKRILTEMREMKKNPSPQYSAHVLDENNIFEWHFTIRGPPDTSFEGGIYHGRILLPPEYPFKPPNIILLTPNGRFEVGTKICLSISAHHPEYWQPSWSIRTVLIALIGFMPSAGGGAVGALDYPDSERRILAKQSTSWICPRCGVCNATELPEGVGTEEQPETAPHNALRTEKEEVIEEAGRSAVSPPLVPTISLPPSTTPTQMRTQREASSPLWLNSLILMLLVAVVGLLLRKIW